MPRSKIAALAGAAALALLVAGSASAQTPVPNPTPTTVPAPVPTPGAERPGSQQPTDAPLTTGTRPEDVPTTTPQAVLPGVDGDAPSDSAPARVQPAPGTVLVENPRPTPETAADADPEVAISPNRGGAQPTTGNPSKEPEKEPDRKPRLPSRQ